MLLDLPVDLGGLVRLLIVRRLGRSTAEYLNQRSGCGGNSRTLLSSEQSGEQVWRLGEIVEAAETAPRVVLS